MGFRNEDKTKQFFILYHILNVLYSQVLSLHTKL